MTEAGNINKVVEVLILALNMCKALPDYLDKMKHTPECKV